MYLSHRFGQQVIAQWILAIAIVGSLIAGTATFIIRNQGGLSFSSTDERAVTLPAVASANVVPGPYELYMTSGAPPSTVQNVEPNVAAAAGERVSGPYELYMTSGTTPIDSAGETQVSPADVAVPHVPNGPWQLYQCAGCP